MAKRSSRGIDARAGNGTAPRYDAMTHTLWFKGKAHNPFPVPAEAQEGLHMAYENAGWRRELTYAELGARSPNEIASVRNAYKGLNGRRGRPKLPIYFSSNGYGAICWYDRAIPRSQQK
jgi:hypothetical protein